VQNHRAIQIFVVSLVGLVIVAAAALLVFRDRAVTGADTPFALRLFESDERGVTTKGADITDGSDIRASLLSSLTDDDTFLSLTDKQRAAMIEQSAAFLGAYLEGVGLDELRALVGHWGGAFPSPEAQQFNERRWPPSDERDRLVAFICSSATLESAAEQTVVGRDGQAVRRMSSRLGSGAVQMRTSPFQFPNAPDAERRSLFGLVIPARYADGSDAVIAFWFQWDDGRGVWIPRWLEFEREGRPYAGAPLF